MAKYCGNCGNELNEKQDVCLKCGTKVKKETVSSEKTSAGYCGNCGAELNPGQEICLKCGVKVKKSSSSVQSKSKIAAGLFGIFLGCFGVHNFYLGYKDKALTQLLMTVLSCGILSFASGIWGLVEGIQILCGSISKDADGNDLID